MENWKCSHRARQPRNLSSGTQTTITSADPRPRNHSAPDKRQILLNEFTASNSKWTNKRAQPPPRDPASRCPTSVRRCLRSARRRGSAGWGGGNPPRARSLSAAPRGKHHSSAMVRGACLTALGSLESSNVVCIPSQMSFFFLITLCF